MSQIIKILSVDDNEFDREVINRALKKSSLDVSIVEAELSQQAQTLLENERFDCLLLDYLLPPSNGLELLKAISEEVNMPAVVMLTGMGDERIAVEAMKSGAQDYIQKDNMTSDTLSKAILNAMSAKQKIRSSEQTKSKLEQMSFYDSLTGLANRNLLLDRLNELVKTSKRHSRRFSLLMMDLDGFKAVNDTLGHAAGDVLLKQISKRLLEATRTSDTAARLGGDEFVILLPDVEDHVDASTVARKLIAAIDQPVEIDGQAVQVSASVGIALFPEHGNDSLSLMQRADKAMYHAKNNKLGCVVYSNKEKNKRTKRISNESADILQGNNMILHYQPRVQLDTGLMCGADVLIRWQHPVLGLMPPQEFIPVAKKNNVIRESSYQLINMVMQQCKIWSSQDRHIPLTINLSGSLLSDHNLATKIETIRQESASGACDITFNIAESELISEPARAQVTLERLVSAGFKISIDNFATGYSSLTYLHDYPIHEIKIDRTFVQYVSDNTENNSLIKKIIDLSKTIGASTVAEGIENIGLWHQMQEMGCDIGQGYYFSPPVSAYELEQWQNNWKIEDSKSITQSHCYPING